MRCRAIPLALLLAAALSWPGPSRAQSAADVAAARDLFREGAALAKAQRWDEARDRYERSLSLKRAPLTLYSLGVALKQTGRMVEALESFRAFLVEMDPSNAATRAYEKPAREAVGELELRVGRVDVRILPAEARGLRVEMDGKEVPKAALGWPRLVDPGEHVLVATATGYREGRLSLKVHEGEQTEASLTLEPEPAPPPAIVPAPVSTPADLPPPALPPAPPGSRALPIGLLGGGAAVFAAGVGVGLWGVKLAGDAPTRDGPEADRARSMALAGDILGGAGLVAAGVGTILLLTTPSHAPARSPQRGWIEPAGGGLRVRF